MSQESHRLFFLIVHVAEQLKKTADRHLLAQANLSTSQAAALRIITESNGTSQSHVARVLKQQESAVGTMTKRLEAAGFILRTRSETDRRAWQLVPTAAGRKALAKLLDAFVPIDRQIETILSPEDIEALSDKMRTILTALDHAEEK